MQSGLPGLPCLFPYSFHLRLGYLQENKTMKTLKPNNCDFQNELVYIGATVKEPTIFLSCLFLSSLWH